jgi:hypothetical protein
MGIGKELGLDPGTRNMTSGLTLHKMHESQHGND